MLLKWKCKLSSKEVESIHGTPAPIHRLQSTLFHLKQTNAWKSIFEGFYNQNAPNHRVPTSLQDSLDHNKWQTVYSSQPPSFRLSHCLWIWESDQLMGHMKVTREGVWVPPSLTPTPKLKGWDAVDLVQEMGWMQVIYKTHIKMSGGHTGVLSNSLLKAL